jgi:hypothetical protein
MNAELITRIKTAYPTGVIDDLDEIIREAMKK